MAQPFDEKNLQLTGDAVQIAEAVNFDPHNLEAGFSAAENGVLVFVSGAPMGQLVWFDRDGKQVAKLGDPGIVRRPRISPDGTRVAAEIQDPKVGTSDIWVYDLARNVKTRFTNDQATDTSPVWSPDGTRIAFSSDLKLYQKDSSGSGNEEVLIESDEIKVPGSWSSDGRFIAYARVIPRSRVFDIWVLPLIGERKPFPLQQAQSYQGGDPELSPDGRFIAYDSYDSGSQQVYVRPFPGQGGKQQVSTDGGWDPRWRRDGKELFFEHEGKMWALEVKSKGSRLEVGNARPLFEAHSWFWGGPVYDVTPDGKRFLVVAPSEGAPETINLVVNWTADLKLSH
jgi:Tol biopolymer transport system component